MLLKKYFNKAVDLDNKSQRSKWISDLINIIYALIDFVNHKVAGQIWYHNDTASAYTVDIIQDVHAEVKCFEKTQQDIGESLLNVEHTDSSLNALEDGHYRLCWDLNFTGHGNHKYHIHLHKNDVVMENIERHVKLSNASDIAYVGSTACSDLLVGDQISLYIHDETGNSTVTVLAGMIGIEKLI